MLDVRNGVAAILRLVIRRHFTQQYATTIMEIDRHDLTFVVLYLDLVCLKYEISVNGFMEMLTRIDIALGRTVMIIERDTR